jgi:hypothetical protein
LKRRGYEAADRSAAGAQQNKAHTKKWEMDSHQHLACVQINHAQPKISQDGPGLLCLLLHLRKAMQQQFFCCRERASSGMLLEAALHKLHARTPLTSYSTGLKVLVRQQHCGKKAQTCSAHINARYTHFSCGPPAHGN